MAACPPSEQLRGFASGILSDDVAAAISTHINTCYECQTSVRDFAKGSNNEPQTSPDAEARIGRELGRYRVDRVLGMGGMGIVYAAWDPQLDRPVAIKVVHRAAADAAGRARLVREAQSLARLSHPNVCHVYDVGTAPSPDNPEGDVWVAMELIDGSKSLREWVHGKTQDQILAVLLGAGDGIAAAHAAGLIHRDIKPENVLVTHDGRPVVTDFGLARLDLPVDPTGATGMIDPLKTATNAIVGTPAYLAPEQLTGGVLDHRVDQFAWAVMAWELLAGVRPFPAIPIVRLDAIVAGPKAPPSLAKQFIAPLARGMAAAPRDRYGSLRELMDALKQPAAPAKRGAGTAVIAAGAAVVAVAATLIVWKLVASDDKQPAPTIATAAPPAPPPPQVAPAPNAAPPVVDSGSGAAPSNPQVTPAPAPAPDPKKPDPTKPGVAKSDPTKPDPTKPDPTRPPKNEQTVGKGVTPGVAPKAPPPAPVDDPNTGGGNTPAPAPAGALEAFLAQHPYNRSSAVAVLDMMCRIPTDAANPGPEKGRHGVVDWGRVTRRELGEVKLGNRSHHAPLYEVKGARGTYQFKADHWSNTVGIPDAKVGQWVALCYDDITEIYEVPPNWKRQMVRLQGIVPLSRPPRVDEIKKWNPLHTSYLSFKRDGGYGKTSMDTSRAYFFQAKVEGLESGIRYDMGGWWMDVPAGIKGANLVGVGKRLWFVVERLRFEDPPDGNKSKLVVTAVAVIDDLFP